MPFPAAAIIGGAIIGGVLSSRSQKDASERAAETQSQASFNEIEELRRQFDLTREDLAPSRESQRFALERLVSLIGDPGQVTNLPGFDFRRQQGREVLEESAAAGGGLFSGNTLQALEEFGQGFATDELNQEFNRLSNLAGLGAGGVNAGVQAGGQSAAAIANAIRAGGGAQAGQQLRQGQIDANLINSIANNALFAGRLQQLQQPGAATPPIVQQGLIGGRTPQPTPLQLSGPF